MKYIVLLRAVNVSGKNIIKMADLRERLTEAGFLDVDTYIQSGNIILTSDDSPAAVKTSVHALLQSHFALDIETFVVDAKQIERIIAGIPAERTTEPNRLFITLLNQIPDEQLVNQLRLTDHGDEWFHTVENVLYFYLPHGAYKAKMSNNYFERKLKVSGTGRNLNTFRKLLELATAP